MGHVRVLLPRKLSPTSAYGVISILRNIQRAFGPHPVGREGAVDLESNESLDCFQPVPQEWRNSAGHQAELRSWGKVLIWKMKAFHSETEEAGNIPWCRDDLTIALGLLVTQHYDFRNQQNGSSHGVPGFRSIWETQQNTCMFQCWQKWAWAKRSHPQRGCAKNQKDAALSHQFSK